MNDRKISKGRYVLYWMQQSQRAEFNHALEYAVEIANHLKLPLIVLFGLMDDYPEASLRHYMFMLEGLKETQAALADRGIKMVIRREHPAAAALSSGRQAAVIICDRGYLRHQKQWRIEVADQADCRVVQVESDVVVPVEQVSDKAEYAARTIRPKIHRLLNDYLVEPAAIPVDHDSLKTKVKGLDILNTEKVIKAFTLDGLVRPVSNLFQEGNRGAKSRFSDFLENRLVRYAQNSNQPQTDDISHMSMYLHFGQISPLYLALKVKEYPEDSEDVKDSKARYLEELIVRRELAINFVNFTPTYDTYECIPEWAKTTLKAHSTDKREHAYSRKELEAVRTHDEYWNAAMKEMKYTGFMHNYMRMYLGEKNSGVVEITARGVYNHIGIKQQVFSGWSGSQFLCRCRLDLRCP